MVLGVSAVVFPYRLEICLVSDRLRGVEVICPELNPRRSVDQHE
jgi:hypothetical protein